MLNIDGVVNGNYRTSLVGVDLNRRWKRPLKFVHPVIFHFKELIHDFSKKYKIALIADLHGHSRSHNIFAYGCHDPIHPELCKLYPFMLSKISPVFSFAGCRFKMQRSKESTLRMSLYKEIGISNVFTIESSFCGSAIGKYSGKHFTKRVL
jgi:hypothetical protein